MDVDWCLSCDRKLVSFPLTLLLNHISLQPQDDSRLASGPYCSTECLSFAQPTLSSSPVPAQPQPAPNAHCIHQWAAAIPPHVPAGAPSVPFADHVSKKASLSPLSPCRPPSLRVRTQATPKLIERTSAITPVPTLCVSSPAQVRPLPPLRSTHCAYPNGNTASNTTASMSEASTSLTSILSEPLVATPEEGDCAFGISAFVRSWVRLDRDHAKSTNEEVVEEIKSHFPHFASSKKTSPSRSKHSTLLKSSSPARVVRKKSPAAKLTFSHDRDLSTSPHSHTPTPVFFPSCRATELDWDDDEDDRESFVSKAHYSHYQPKYEPQARAPSTATSDSSGSSVLLMASKRWDGTRGRRSGRVIVA